VSALNKHWRPVSVDEFLHGMDAPATRNAIVVAQLSDGLKNWIWEEPKKDGLVWLS
jgi:hypothetical protein